MRDAGGIPWGTVLEDLRARETAIAEQLARVRAAIEACETLRKEYP